MNRSFAKEIASDKFKWRMLWIAIGGFTISMALLVGCQMANIRKPLSLKPPTVPVVNAEKEKAKFALRQEAVVAPPIPPVLITNITLKFNDVLQYAHREEYTKWMFRVKKSSDMRNWTTVTNLGIVTASATFPVDKTKKMEVFKITVLTTNGLFERDLIY